MEGYHWLPKLFSHWTLGYGSSRGAVWTGNTGRLRVLTATKCMRSQINQLEAEHLFFDWSIWLYSLNVSQVECSTVNMQLAFIILILLFFSRFLVFQISCKFVCIFERSILIVCFLWLINRYITGRFVKFSICWNIWRKIVLGIFEDLVDSKHPSDVSGS